MTDIQAVLAEMRAALEKATPGDWEIWNEGATVVTIGNTAVAHVADALWQPDAMFVVLLHNKAAVLLDMAEAAARVALAFDEWEFLNRKGDGMPAEVESEFYESVAALRDQIWLSGATPEEARG